MRKVIFREFGGPEILAIEQVPVPDPGPGEVLVRVVAAGLNPVDHKLFSGRPMYDHYERSLPSGNGYDFSGIVVACGPGTNHLVPGDQVFGGLRYHAQGDFLTIDERSCVLVPEGLSLVVAGALNVVGRTAVASVRSQQLGPDDRVLVSGAAGGVGVLTAQLVRETGASVIGTASPRNHDYLRRLGIRPVSYGPGLRNEIQQEVPGGLTAVLDSVGHGTVSTALELGVAPERINTIADYPAITAHGVRGVGGADAGVDELALIAELLAERVVELPIDSVHPLEDVQSSYALLMGGHARGKIVLAL